MRIIFQQPRTRRMGPDTGGDQEAAAPNCHGVYLSWRLNGLFTFYAPKNVLEKQWSEVLWPVVEMTCHLKQSLYLLPAPPHSRLPPPWLVSGIEALFYQSFVLPTISTAEALTPWASIRSALLSKTYLSRWGFKSESNHWNWGWGWAGFFF